MQGDQRSALGGLLIQALSHLPVDNDGKQFRKGKLRRQSETFQRAGTETAKMISAPRKRMPAVQQASPGDAIAREEIKEEDLPFFSHNRMHFEASFWCRPPRIRGALFIFFCPFGRRRH